MKCKTIGCIKLYSLCLGLLLIQVSVAAQRKDSLAAYRQFMEVCNGYKSLPLQASIQFQTKCNLAAWDRDTLTKEAVFFLDSSGSYIRYGDIEQLSNDSTLLMINRSARQMLFYPGQYQVKARMQQLAGIRMADSSAEKLARRYIVTRELCPEAGVEMLKLQSRQLLPNSNLPKEEIAIRFYTENSSPLQVTQMTRDYKQVDSAYYTALQANTEYDNRLAKTEDGFYAVLEKKDIFTYVSIAHQNNAKFPVVLADCIFKTSDGVYQPAEVYKDFSFSIF